MNIIIKYKTEPEILAQHFILTHLTLQQFHHRTMNSHCWTLNPTNSIKQWVSCYQSFSKGCFQMHRVTAGCFRVSYLTTLFLAVSLILGAAPSTNINLSIPLSWRLLLKAWCIFFSRFLLKNLGDKVAATSSTQLLTQPQQTLPPYPTCICFTEQWLLPQKDTQ